MSDDNDDKYLFRSAMQDVRRIRGDRIPPTRRPIKATPRQRQLDEARVMQELLSEPIDFEAIETGEEIHWLQAGLQRRVLTRLRRGHWRVQDEIDLHEMNTQAAASVIRTFLDLALRDGLSCVKIIHGKGLRSGPDGPQLKRLTARLLVRHPRVCAFASAPSRDGGTGAVYVLLRNKL